MYAFSKGILSQHMKRETFAAVIKKALCMTFQKELNNINMVKGLDMVLVVIRH